MADCSRIQPVLALCKFKSRMPTMTTMVDEDGDNDNYDNDNDDSDDDDGNRAGAVHGWA